MLWYLNLIVYILQKDKFNFYREKRRKQIVSFFKEYNSWTIHLPPLKTMHNDKMQVIQI